MARNGDRNGGYVGWSQSDREELGILRTRLSGLERDVQDLSTVVQQQISSVNSNINALGAKMEERGKIQWPAFSLLLAAILAIGGLVYWPIRENQSRFIDLIDRVQASTVTKTENELRFVAGAARRDDIQRLTDARIERAERDIAAVEAKLVGRGEHEQTWAGQRQKDADLQRQIDELRKGFGDLYSPRDALGRLIQRVDGLERELRARGVQPPPSG